MATFCRPSATEALSVIPSRSSEEKSRRATSSFHAVMLESRRSASSAATVVKAQSPNRVVAELGAIGRNLNQMARAAHQAAPAAEHPRVDVMAIIRVGEALRDHVKALLKANAVSWKVGHGEPHT